MQKPMFKVIRLGDDVITSSPGCNVCSPDCISVQSHCEPICVKYDPNVCDCVGGDD